MLDDVPRYLEFNSFCNSSLSIPSVFTAQESCGYSKFLITCSVVRVMHMQGGADSCGDALSEVTAKKNVYVVLNFLCPVSVSLT